MAHAALPGRGPGRGGLVIPAFSLAGVRVRLHAGLLALLALEIGRAHV